MTQDELTLVLEALKWCHGGEPCGTAEAIAVVEKALAQPEQEPVAWVWVNNKGWLNYGETPHDMFKSSPLYPHPQRSESSGKPAAWVGLTDEEVRQMCGSVPSMREAVRETEAKLKEKNT